MCGRVSLLRRLSGAVLTVAAVLPLCGATVARSTPPRESVAAGQQYYPEVRLRKLHLVRPDLIPYPLSFEVYC